MDGYALRSADTTSRACEPCLVGSIAAGSPVGRPLAPARRWRSRPAASCRRAPTRSSRSSSRDRWTAASRSPRRSRPGATCAARGGDVRAGAVLLEPGHAARRRPGRRARCGRRRRSALREAAAGRDPRDRLGAACSRASRSARARSTSRTASCSPRSSRPPARCRRSSAVVPDDEEEHRKAMEKALLGFDMLVTSGGASVGPARSRAAGAGELRVEEVFWGVAMKPGKPVAFGVRRDHLVFNLPGTRSRRSSASSCSCDRRSTRCSGSPTRCRLRAGVLGAPVTRNESRDEFVRARREAGREARCASAGRRARTRT